MKRLLQSWMIVALAATAPSTLHAEQTTRQMHDQAETALADGMPQTALTLTQKLIAQDPQDFTALFVQSLAYSDLGQDQNAAIAAAKAYRAARTNAEKLQAARLAGVARFQQQQHLRAQWWLRLAANHASSPEEITTVTQEFQRIQASNPLSIRGSFSIAPSDNINNGAEDELFMLEGIDIAFGLSPERLPLSGIEAAGDIQLSYRLSQSYAQITTLDTYLYGRTYRLSDKAQSRVPDRSGSDYALALAEVSLSHRRNLFDGLGTSSISAHLGHVWFGGDPLWDYQKIAIGQEFPIGDRAVFALQSSVQNQTALDDVQPDTVVYEAVAGYGAALANSDQLQLTLSGKFNDAATGNDTFTDYSAGINYAIAEPVFGARWSVSAGLGYTKYDDFFLRLDGKRRDKYATVGGTVVFDNVSYFGFSPSVTVTAKRTVSNVSLFTNAQLQGRIGIESNF